jgi:transposase
MGNNRWIGNFEGYPMSRFVEGEPRTQSLLFPERLDDWIAEDNPVRVIDVFVDELDLKELGFEGAVPAETGRPAYHPSTLLKIYIYGYLNRVQSSRRLEREAQRNVEVVWLTGRLMPDFKTIADFRKDNGPAIRKVCARFIQLCRQMKLFTEAVVAIDGSKFKAVNNRDRNFTEQKIKSRMEHLEKSVKQYLDDLDRADREPASVPEARVSQLKQKIVAIKAEMRKLAKTREQLPKVEGQLSLTDPDARSMNSAGKGTGTVGYNVQTAVDTKNHMIVAHEVTNVGGDRSQLTEMAKLAREALGTRTLTALADRGYYSGEQIRGCQQVGITALVPKPLTSNSRAAGRFDKRDFVYSAKRDEYRCPAGERAIWRCDTIEDGLKTHLYWSSACPRCPLKERCTPSTYRRIRRWEHEEVLEAMQRRMDRTPEASKLRRRTAEHPFATLKAWMGATHFLTKTLPKVRTEMSLHVLAYNMKRAMNLLGTEVLLRAITA